MKDGSVKHLSGNKGEWSEIYTLFKLLGEGVVSKGDITADEMSYYYPITSIERVDGKRYTYSPDTIREVVVIREGGKVVAEISMNEFLNESRLLLEDIKNAKSADGAFCNQRTEAFMKKVYCSRLKASSQDKADIHINLYDSRTQTTHYLGFSIKSQLGSPSTLLNAGVPTNIRFRVSGDLGKDDVDRINAVKDHLPRMAALYEIGCELKYDCVEHPTFRNNLLFLDLCMPEFIADCLLVDSISDKPKIKDAVAAVAAENPFDFQGNTKTFYEHKMKRLLLASALGMTPAKEWKGHFDANGGYLVVDKEGKIVCYHFYNQNDIEDYLFKNTRFERASRGRYKFGELYSIPGKEGYYFNLNLQIRFIK